MTTCVAGALEPCTDGHEGQWATGLWLCGQKGGGIKWVGGRRGDRGAEGRCRDNLGEGSPCPRRRGSGHEGEKLPSGKLFFLKKIMPICLRCEECVYLGSLCAFPVHVQTPKLHVPQSMLMCPTPESNPGSHTAANSFIPQASPSFLVI